MNTITAIRTRRSTRKMKDIVPPKDLIEQVVEAGRRAPSGGNSQTTHFIVIQNREVLNELAELARSEFAAMDFDENTYGSLKNSIQASRNGNYVFHYNAPVLIVTTNKKDYGNNMADCACALENMMLMANELNLGSCWINQLRWLRDHETIRNKMIDLGMAEDETVCGALILGYADREDDLPDRTERPVKGNPVTWID